MTSWWRPTIALIGPMVLIAGCSERFPPVAVGAAGGSPMAVWKFCDPGRGIGSLTVSRVTGADSDDWPAVWMAQLDDGATAVSRMSIEAALPGYAIVTAELPLAPNQTYALTDAADADGVDVLPEIIEFTVAEVRQDTTTAGSSFDGDLDAWLGTTGPPCG